MTDQHRPGGGCGRRALFRERRIDGQAHFGEPALLVEVVAHGHEAHALPVGLGERQADHLRALLPA